MTGARPRPSRDAAVRLLKPSATPVSPTTACGQMIRALSLHGRPVRRPRWVLAVTWCTNPSSTTPPPTVSEVAGAPDVADCSWTLIPDLATCARSTVTLARRRSYRTPRTCAERPHEAPQRRRTSTPTRSPTKCRRDAVPPSTAVAPDPGVSASRPSSFADAEATYRARPRQRGSKRRTGPPDAATPWQPHVDAAYLVTSATRLRDIAGSGCGRRARGGPVAPIRRCSRAGGASCGEAEFARTGPGWRR